MESIKIGIFDDHPITGRGLTEFMLANNIEVLFCVTNKVDLYNNLLTKEIDIVLLDIVAPDIAGLELFEEILKKHQSIYCIAYTTLNSIILVENLISIGVKGFINKKQDPSEIIKCINKVYNHEISIPPQFHFLTSKYHNHKTNILSSREIEVLNLISKEFTSSEIAEKLSLSIFTVENHRKSIFKKFEVKNLAGMIMVANRLGYIS